MPTLQLTGADIEKAALLLQGGDLVAFPTETVYGLGADATNPEAVAAIYAAKGRPSFNPLIVHVADIEMAREIAVFDDIAEQVAAAFWPGPITLVLPVRLEFGISDLVTAGLDTIAIRMPAAPLSRNLIARASRPIAAPSANPSGTISPTTAQHVLDGLNGRIAAVLDGGSCEVGLESTILRTTPLTLLRPGGVPVEELEALLGEDIPGVTSDEGISAPGQLASHYAPNSRLRLGVEAPRAAEVMIGFGPVNGHFNLSEQGDLTEAATHLFATLRKADLLAQNEGKTLAAAPIPDKGLGVAINDRLARAAAPRD
ncbi:L-threonylcarbamoyladenylate synthase [Litoreibacter roseus]|uniref:Threonylcarbamoyl-AMP synthase n=1 Tax=Litoreibacter roseus TaxID=2601869 RepID=A0A6N6JFU3_9RHOB|nr:L-threonylcarbamoyladenylate synthase [Litoreibacter roseus]GFE64837.1 threonylcarbamoyl-AMP synthase [Litoreibacter roseus]